MRKIERILSRRQIAWIIYACLSLRVIMPAGYMPAPLADGLPFILCPDGIFSISQHHPATNQQDQHSADAEGDSDHASSGAGESCQFGGAFGAAAPTADTSQNVFLFERVKVPVAHAAFIRSSLPQPYRARAPPQQSIRA